MAVAVAKTGTAVFPVEAVVALVGGMFQMTLRVLEALVRPARVSTEPATLSGQGEAVAVVPVDPAR